MSIIKKYYDKKWTLQFLNALYNSIDMLGIFINSILTTDLLYFKGGICVNSIFKPQICR
jgi:hypothetical protein